MIKEDLIPTINNDLIATFEYGDFIIEVTYDYAYENNEVWIRNVDSPIKYLYGVIDGNKLCDCNNCIDFMLYMISDFIDDAIETYMEHFGETIVVCDECDECSYSDIGHCSLDE